MTMEWHGTLLFHGNDVLASIGRDHRKGLWFAKHRRWVHQYANPITKGCKTEAGIKRRCEYYASLWLVAGKPELDGDQ